MSIGSLLDAYRARLRPPQQSVVNVVCTVVKEVTTLSLTPAEVTYVVGTKTVRVKTRAVKTTEIHLHRVKILQRLREELGEHAPKEIH